MRRLLSVLMAAFMLLTMPLTTGISRAIAEGANEPTETETTTEGIALEMEDLDPATLHIHKLGEDEEEEQGEFDPEDPEPIDLNRIVRASIFLDEKSTIDKGYSTQGIANNSSATAYRNKLKQKQADMQRTIEAEIGHELNVKWNLTLLVNAISVEVPYKDIMIIRRIPGVKSVELENIYSAPEPVDGDQPMTANTSSGMVGAQAAWADGYTAAVANYVCANDSEHTKTETATVTSTTTAATCEVAGSTVYTATEGGHTDTKTVTIPAIGHAWGEATYVWAADNSTVTATRVCANDANHVETETVNTSYEVTTAPTFNTVGEGVYTATFTNPAFTEQTKTVEIPKLTESATVAYVDFRHGKTLQVFTVEIKDGEDTPTPAFTAFDQIGTYDDCRYDADDMWTTTVASTVMTDTVYVLKWINVCTVTFLDAEGAIAKAVSVDENGTIPENEIPAPEKEGYTITGWNEADLAFDVTQPIKRNVTLTPVYTINTYTVTFVNNGETYLEVEVQHGATMTAPQQPDGNQVFDGWYNGETPFDFDTPITGDLTLTAHWSEEVVKTGTRIVFADGAVQLSGTTPYVVWNGGAMTPAFTVEGETVRSWRRVPTMSSRISATASPAPAIYALRSRRQDMTILRTDGSRSICLRARP